MTGNVAGYARTFEIKQLSVPVKQAEELRKFYRIIASDARTVVLKPSPWQFVGADARECATRRVQHCRLPNSAL